MTSATDLVHVDMFGEESTFLATDDKPQLLIILPDLDASEAVAIGRALVRPDSEINAAPFNVLLLGEAGSPLGLMATSGFNSPCGTVSADALGKSAYRAASAAGGAFVIEGGQITFERVPAVAQELLDALAFVRSKGSGEVSTPAKVDAAVLAQRLEAAASALENGEVDLESLRQLVWEVTQVIYKPETATGDLSVLAPLMERLQIQLIARSGGAGGDDESETQV